ncbi:TRZ/ATZ family hydrolase [Sesbania bispinosa]|nr:TRZ/ATZ family hydrolase [Sesbania bispinosa]
MENNCYDAQMEEVVSGKQAAIVRNDVTDYNCANLPELESISGLEGCVCMGCDESIKGVRLGQQHDETIIGSGGAQVSCDLEAATLRKEVVE